MNFDKLDFRPDGVIFDVDGTIWDSTPIVTEAWNRALVDTGHPQVSVTADRLKGLFGLPMLEIMRDVLPGVSEKEVRAFDKVCIEYEQNALIESSGIPYLNIEETIKKLSESCKVIIVSNCQSGYIELMMKHLGIEAYVTDKICHGDNGLSKAENIILMNERHSLKRSVYVGDTIMDANACKEAEEFFIFASYGFGHVEEPDAVIDEPEQLLEMFEN